MNSERWAERNWTQTCLNRKNVSFTSTVVSLKTRDSILITVCHRILTVSIVLMPCVALFHDDAAPFGSLFVFTSRFGCAIST